MTKKFWLLLAAILVVGAPLRAEYRQRTVSDGGTIRGTVRIVGEVPKLPPQPVYKHVDVCGDTIVDERLEVGKGGVLTNVIVSLTDVSSGKPVPLDEPVTLDNVKCRFVPHVLAATLGQKLVIRNSDPFLHDAHAWLGDRTLFNLALLKGRNVERGLTDAGLIHINCNVRHTWMRAYIFVSENPYHAVTGSDGSFVIDGIPPGTYTLDIWHELLGSQQRKVTVEGGKTTTITVDVASTAPEDAEQTASQGGS